MPLAPVAVFAFKRAEHTRALLESLRRNPEIADTEVYAFCDGPRSANEADAVRATREVVQSCGLPRLTVVEQPRNLGLAASVIGGVTRLCGAHGRVIVLEDDLVVAPTFLEYMNAALDRYRDAASVHAVSGFMYPVAPPAGADAAFLPFISSWGWATWGRAWGAFDEAGVGAAALRRSRAARRRFDLGGAYPFSELLEAQQRGEVNSWAIRWYLSVFLRDGLCLFPARSLVENHGFGTGATHCVEEAPLAMRSAATAFRVARWPEARVDSATLENVRHLLARDYGLRARMLNRVYRLLRRWVPARRRDVAR